MKINKIKFSGIKKLAENGGNIKAMVSVNVDEAPNCFINFATIVEGANGLFLSFVSEKSGKNEDSTDKYSDVIGFLNKEAREKISKMVLDAWNKGEDAVGGTVTFSGVEKLAENGGKTKAFVSLTVNNLESFFVNNIRVIDGPNGLFVSPPARKSGVDGEGKDTYRGIFGFTTKEDREAFNTAIIDAYNAEIAK